MSLTLRFASVTAIHFIQYLKNSTCQVWFDNVYTKVNRFHLPVEKHVQYSVLFDNYKSKQAKFKHEQHAIWLVRWRHMCLLYLCDGGLISAMCSDVILISPHECGKSVAPGILISSCINTGSIRN